MKCALRLEPRSGSVTTEGYFVQGHHPSVLARFLSNDINEMPRIFALATGYLLVGKLNAITPGGGAIKLQSLSGRLYFPVTARLIPALLSDEAAGIARGLGLVLLPHRPAMVFNPERPLALSDWIDISFPTTSHFAPFPKRAQTAKELSRIERPNPPVMAILEILGGAPDQARPLKFDQDGKGSDKGNQGPIPEDARPPESSAWETIKGQMNLKSGQLLAWIGQMAHLPGLAKLGANMAKQALEKVPRLTEKLLGSQEAALREVLRQLRSGDIEKGLRRAPVAVSDPQSSPGRVGTGSQLSDQSPLYSLMKLLGSAGQSITWLGGGTVWNELAGEYRKLAQEAMERGDYRRAAYLYGFLLNDLRSAAGALVAGGLFRDAAIIYRDKLNDPTLAATTFEKAGDWDEAVRLYVQLNKFELAGDLLVRMGEEEQAREMFIRQADLHAQADRHLLAGDLIAKKVGDHDLASRYFLKGWAANGVETRVCGQRLLAQSGAEKDWDRFQRLTMQAQAKLGTIGYEEVSRILNDARKISREHFNESRDRQLKDQTKLFFGAIVQAESKHSKKRGENAASTVFPQGDIWHAAVHRDAVFASRALAGAPARTQHAEKEPATLTLLKGPVRFAIVSRQTRDLVVASDAQIVVWRPDQGTIHPVVNHASYGKTIGIASDPIASKIYVLTSVEMATISGPVEDRDDPENPATEEVVQKYFLSLFVFRSGSAFQLATSVEIDASGGTPWLQTETEAGDPSLSGESSSAKAAQIIHVDTAKERLQFTAFDLLQKRTTAKSSEGGLFFSANASHGSYWSWDRFTVTFTEMIMGRSQIQEWSPGWFSYWETPQVGRGMRFDWIFPSPRQLDLVWVDLAANLHWSSFEVLKLAKARSSHRIHSGERPYRAACILGAGKMAALTENGEIHWLKMIEGKFVRYAARDKPLVQSPLAHLFARTHAEELIALDENGSAVRLKIP